MPARFAGDAPSLPTRSLAPRRDPAAWVAVFFDIEAVPVLVSAPGRAELREPLALPLVPTREEVFAAVVFRAVLLVPLPSVAGLPADLPDLAEVRGATPLRAAVPAAVDCAAVVFLPVEAPAERRPADVPVAFAGAALVALPRPAAVAPVDGRADAFRVEAAFAGVRLVAAFDAAFDAAFFGAAFGAVFFAAVFFNVVRVDAAVAEPRLADARTGAAVFVGARAVALFVAGDLLPVVAALVAVLLADAFLAAGLLAPVFPLADLRELLVAMPLSRGLVALRGGPCSISPAACREGDRRKPLAERQPKDGENNARTNAGPTSGSSSSVNNTP